MWVKVIYFALKINSLNSNRIRFHICMYLALLMDIFRIRLLKQPRAYPVSMRVTFDIMLMTVTESFIQNKIYRIESYNLNVIWTGQTYP